MKQINLGWIDQQSLSFVIVIFAQTTHPPPPQPPWSNSKSATIISMLLELWTKALQDSSNMHAVACIWSENVGNRVRYINVAWHQGQGVQVEPILAKLHQLRSYHIYPSILIYLSKFTIKCFS